MVLQSSGGLRRWEGGEDFPIAGKGRQSISMSVNGAGFPNDVEEADDKTIGT